MVRLGSLIKHYREVLNALYGGEGRAFIGEVIEELDKSWGSANVFILEAPTGYGKTAVSLTVAKYSVEEELKAVVAYPLRTLLEQQVGVFRKLFRVCGLGEGLVGVRYMMNAESPYFVRPATLTTVDTLALTTLGIAPEDLGKALASAAGRPTWGSMGHYVFSWASTFTSNMVIDEAHLLADSGKAISFISFLAREAVLHDQHLIIMTATLPQTLVKAVEAAVGWRGRGRIRTLSFTSYALRRGGEGDPFIRDRLSKEYAVEAMPVEGGGGVKAAVEWLEAACGRWGRGGRAPQRVLAVFNTVAEAVEAYRLALKKLPIERERILLIHSRFTAADREGLSRRLDALAEEARGGGGRPYAVVATQAVEAGVDITSNIFSTDAAPPTTVVQRAGRFLRYGGASGKALLWWDVRDGGSLSVGRLGLYKVYDPRLVKETIDWVRRHEGRVNLHLPTTADGKPPGYSTLLQKAYAGAGPGVRERRLIAALEDIVTDYMRGSRRAAELLMGLGGSLVRDSTLVPLIPKDLAREAAGDPERLAWFTIPSSPATLLKLYGEGKVVAAVADGEIVEPPPHGVRELLSRAAKHLRSGRTALALKQLVRAAAGSGLDAFVVNAPYDVREGLRLE